MLRLHGGALPCVGVLPLQWNCLRSTAMIALDALAPLHSVPAWYFCLAGLLLQALWQRDVAVGAPGSCGG